MPVTFSHAQQIGTTDLLRGLAAPSRWLIHSGDYTSKRHSPLTQITPENVTRLTPLWTFEAGLGFGRGAKFEATPIAIDGTFMDGLLNHAWAIDGRTGKMIWHYERDLPSATRVCCGMVNRGFAVFGDRLFMTTLDAHVIALDRKTGAPIWDVAMIDYQLGYSATAAPLVVKNKLIVGMAGGELATRGFLDAYSLETGKRIWRFNTIPAPGEPGGDTWPVGHYERGGGPTWITGSYDPELNLLYWGIGNPNPDFFHGGNRPGDNLVPHRLWPWILTPDDCGGISNTRRMTSTTGIRIKSRCSPTSPLEAEPARRSSPPIETDSSTRRSRYERRVHPGATVCDHDVGKRSRCQGPTDRAARSAPDAAGHAHLSRSGRRQQLHVAVIRSGAAPVLCVSARDLPGLHRLCARKCTNSATTSWAAVRNRGGTGALRAIDPVTLERKWEVPYGGPSYSGVLSTASGLVFAGDHGSTLMAVKSDTGHMLWSHRLAGTFLGVLSTVMVDERQLVLMTAGQTLTAFALGSPTTLGTR